MKTNCRLSFNFIFTLFILSVLTWSCDKEVDPKLLPVLTTTEVIKMTEATAYSGGNITSDAGSNVTSRGVCWSESPNPTIDDKKTIDAAGTGVFESRIVGLNPNTTYYVRAYAANKKGVAYGLQVTFKTKSLSITTTPITSTTISSAVSGGTLETDGDSLNVTERGICWGTSAKPTIENSKIANGKGKGKYAASITQLQIATQYFVRAYAKNETGTFYGDELSFITTNGTMTLTTIAATSITAISATVGGSVPNDGGATVTARGFCISKLPNPTIANKIANGSGVGAFASNITGLEANTTYYVRVFATNSIGTAYGNEISFTTKDGIVTLTTATATSITATSATSGGTITNDGGAAITARGLCWGTTPNPTIANSKSTNTGTTGSFATNLTGLSIGATYFLRAYATNAAGTSYGNEISFKTLSGIVTLVTTSPSVITSVTAKSGGNILSDEGVSVIECGVCWSKSDNPTINNNYIKSSTQNNFNIKLTGLDANTNYYIRAYANNAAGTFYGNQLSFETPNTVTDIDGNVYNTVIIGTQTWMIENLRTTKLNDGTTIANVTNNSSWAAMSSAAYCWYNNNTSYKTTFGALYNWHVVNTGKLAPAGWHVPSDSEWTTLENYVTANLSTNSSVTKALASNTNWKISTSAGAIGNDLNMNNSSGFSALPSGSRYNVGTFSGLFSYIDEGSLWWSSTAASAGKAWFRLLYTDFSGVGRNSGFIEYGYSVRCVKN